MKKLLMLVVMALAITGSGFAAEMVSTYKIAAYVDVESAKSKLSAEGFEVVGTLKATDAGTTILYTNAAMKAEAAKENRAFNAVGRILVDDERKQISIANPLYFGAAFMQKDFKQSASLKVLNSLKKAFGSLKDSEDAWDAKGLANYHFMMGMPYYEDMDTVGSGSTADLVAKAKAAKGTVVQVGADRYVAFVELDKRTSGFVKKIGSQNGEILPYAVLIEGGQAKALNAKYYIAISYPLLTMTEFMGISTVPDAITKGLQKIFK
ncbi:MAG: hypothetical protein PHW18_06780 [Sulfuricurvum sp.]|uniref:hypothetical protein n=1 Tax=Sulfuricurvum sp. TaxID=2025608 RepID=UPI00262EBDFC|nr:hypothetical protein [Sulfuricurvum sp.]MDD2829263.1 hypothetical protein [Sulfuricurvum sp.]MDD4949973.1 hypothetical protein [Sulfuricurvum sp.]